MRACVRERVCVCVCVCVCVYMRRGVHEEWGEGGCVSYAWTVARRLCLVLRPIGRGFSVHFDLQPTLTPCTNLGSVLR